MPVAQPEAPAVPRTAPVGIDLARSEPGLLGREVEVHVGGAVLGVADEDQVGGVGAGARATARVREGLALREHDPAAHRLDRERDALAVGALHLEVIGLGIQVPEDVIPAVAVVLWHLPALGDVQRGPRRCGQVVGACRGLCGHAIRGDAEVHEQTDDG